MPSNQDRASWARAALDTFKRATRNRDALEDYDLADLIADLLHLSDAEGFDTAYVYDHGWEQYAEELAGDDD